MICNWPEARLGDNIDSCLGKMLDKKKNKGTPQPYLGNSNVRWGTFELDDLAEMRFEESEFERYSLKKGDLVVCEGGEPGRCAIWEGEAEEMKIQKALHRVRPKENLDNYYLYYWFLYAGKTRTLEPYFTGTTIKHLTGKALSELPIRIPPMEVQLRCAEVLKSLDRKVSQNTRINQTLEQMAQAIFKSWFVDFEPVTAKMNGKQPEGMDAATASLFPEKLVESELGLIPDGWEAGTVGSVTTAKGGYAFKSKQFVDEGNPVIKIKNISSSGTVNTLECQCIDDDIASTASRFKLSNGDLLMAMTGATVGKSGIYVSDGRDGYLNQRVARFESKVDSSNPCWFTYNLVTKDSIFEQIVGAAQGSAQPNISSKGIEQVKAVIPTHDLIGKYQELVAPLYAKWISNFQENSQLSELRDTLLPKLLSGEIELDKVLDV
ncbi:restriction endonuclease subunit S [Vibrio lentus]|uniref:restriction endonuclease subunit S n=1 Tax=Vibrio lentus TaxID=136468 RepID=UPI000C85C8C5|nr:restriction endonuclease subunit S [Vibrio lentus]MCC5488911.1 restriction endonuclease subunit S [Vibrio lentus]